MNINSPVKSQNPTPGLCFLLLLSVWIFVFFYPKYIGFAISGMIVFPFLFFIYYLISEGHIGEIIGGIFLSFILIAIAAKIPVLGWILLFCWILYNIYMALSSIRKLLPDALLSIILYTSLIIPVIHHFHNHGKNNMMLSVICGIIYLLAAVGCYVLVDDRSDRPKHSIFIFSVILLSVPIIVLLLVSIISSLRAVFQTNLVATKIKVPQSVSDYTTARGTNVASYTRNITQTIMTAETVPGMGAVNVSLTGTLGKLSSSTDNLQTKEQLKDKDLYITNKEHNFYRYDELNDKKINNYTQAVASNNTLPPLQKEDIAFYFDETLLGNGDKGVVITDDAIYCLLGWFDDDFYTRFSDIKKIALSGILNKKITLYLKDGDQKTIILTQSNPGAEKLYKIINIYISTIMLTKVINYKVSNDKK